MRQVTFKGVAIGLLAGGLMSSTAHASTGDVTASGCHLGDHAHPHAEFGWAWLAILLLPLVLRGRFLRRR